MLDGTEGIYFDGLSSKPFIVSAGFNNDYSALIFSSEEVPETEWPINEIIPDIVGNRITIRHKFRKEEAININDPAFREIFFYHYHRKGNSGLYHRILHAGNHIHIAVALSLIALIAAAYFYFIPWLSEKAVAILPVSYDESLGESVYKNFIEGETIDSSKTEAIRRFAGKINFLTDRKLNFTIIYSNEVNAFALPDGHIIIFTGIMNKINTYPQLVSLMGHEAAHVTYRHSMRALCRNLSGYLVISVLTTDVNGIMTVLANNANQLNNLSYSRTYESDADRQGYEILKQNNINPNGMIELFEILKNSEGTHIPEFLSTHPLTEQRINKAKRLIENGTYSYGINEDLKKEFENIKRK